jgi:DNA mismatch repair protein MutH
VELQTENTRPLTTQQLAAFFFLREKKEMTAADKKVLELRQKQNKAKAMATVAKKRGDYLLATFYENARKGYEKKIFAAQFVQ